MNLYDTLGVPKNASDKDIKHAYRRKSSKAHPDKAGGSTAAQQELNKAYAVLSNQGLREKYDRTGDDGATRTPTVDEQAAQHICKGFMAHMESPDPLAAIRRQIKDQQQALAIKLREIDQQVSKLTKALGKVQLKKGPKSGTNLYEGVINQRLAGAANKKAELTEQGAMLARALEMLADYKAGPNAGAHEVFDEYPSSQFMNRNPNNAWGL